jgi:nicotinate-nucleotide adenylyltransferase
MRKVRSKVGILGGLFDPPHFGHLIIAQHVLEEFKLDRVIFIPAYDPPHKARYSPYAFRIKMTRLAIKGNGKFSVSDIESSIKGKTYTVEVIKALRCRMQAHFYLIIGADQWNDIGTWRSPEEIFHECRIVVVPRPGYRKNRTMFGGKRLLVSTAPLMDISSTVIRDRLRRKKPVDYHVPPNVLSYIKKHKLYLST